MVKNSKQKQNLGNSLCNTFFNLENSLLLHNTLATSFTIFICMLMRKRHFFPTAHNWLCRTRPAIYTLVFFDMHIPRTNLFIVFRCFNDTLFHRPFKKIVLFVWWQSFIYFPFICLFYGI